MPGKMNTMTNSYKQEIAEKTAEILDIPQEDVLSKISTPPPGVEGDFSIPCFHFAKIKRESPIAIADKLAEQLSLSDNFEKVLALKGYLNFFTNTRTFIQQTLEQIFKLGQNYGQCDSGAGKKVTIDFSSPNMGKELAFHHLRGTMLGNSLSRIYRKCGFEPVRINHLGDWGTSYGKLILMYLQENLPEDDKYLSNLTIATLNRLYQSFAKASASNQDLEDSAREIFKDLEKGNQKYKKLWSSFRETTLQELKRLYEILDVSFDDYRGESFYIDMIEGLTGQLEKENISEESRGSVIVKFEDENMTPLMLKKSDGSTLYATRDLCAATYRKNEYNFHKNLYVVDMGQSLHFRQLFQALKKMGHEWYKDCEHIAFGLILTKSEDGKWERGKTRAGGVSLLKDVIDEASARILEIINAKNPELKNKEDKAKKIAVGALTFNGLKNKRQNDVNFDWDTVLSFEGDTGPYIINAYVRLCSIIRKWESLSGLDFSSEVNSFSPDYSCLCDGESSDLVKALAMFPDRIILALEKNDPCILSQYCLSVAEKSHRFLHVRRVLGTPEEKSRLFLCNCIRTVLKEALYLIGLPLVEEM